MANKYNLRVKYWVHSFTAHLVNITQRRYQLLHLHSVLNTTTLNRTLTILKILAFSHPKTICAMAAVKCLFVHYIIQCKVQNALVFTKFFIHYIIFRNKERKREPKCSLLNNKIDMQPDAQFYPENVSICGCAVIR